MSLVPYIKTILDKINLDKTLKAFGFPLKWVNEIIQPKLRLSAI